MQKGYREEPEKISPAKVLDESSQNIEARFEEIFGDFSGFGGEKFNRQREFLKKSRNLKKGLK